ncbi:glycosyltransferase [Oceanicoccus sagamiensis]|uniref:Glycosyl transferase family 1 domain-containing protein n=1 Tax=Oceanicoccus sagamiensis TaxID=716816 RepID=A0A1X9NG96_9GAMM|nr:glycosyltransferase [Oceanicoccus sagamiensis]ARN74519.1 hypothetical protein BST96_10545 [Oceanicoccus sagamiensis]
MNKIKILFCIDKLVRGGTELQLIGLIKHLDRTIFEPHLLTIRESDSDLIPEDCIHLHWPTSKIFAPQGFLTGLKLTKYLNNQNISIVQTFFQDSTILAGAAAKLANVPVRISCFRDMGFWQSTLQNFVLKRINHVMTGHIANAQIVARHFHQAYAIPMEKMAIFPNGLDQNTLPFSQARDRVANIAMVGNMTRQVKRFDLFVAAAALVSENHPDIRWHIIGEGHLRSDLEQQARELGVLDKIIFTGRISHIPDYLNDIDIGIICSDSEGLSNAIIEYMFKGVTTIATNVGGNPELVEHTTTGLLVEAGDHQQLADQILNLIKHPELRHQLAQNARDTVEKKYSWEYCVQAHQNYYLQQLEGLR